MSSAPPGLARDRLLELVVKLGVVRGRVVLSSGRVADWYVDLRRITLHHEAAPLVGRVLLDLTADWYYDAVGGLTLGADPVATAMLHASAASAASAGGTSLAGRGAAGAGAVPARPSLDAFVVRKQGKSHGLQRRIEGPDVAGRPVLAVEDTSTTGASVLAAVDALREAGATVVGVAVVVDRGAGEAVRAAGLAYRAAYTLADLGLSD